MRTARMRRKWLRLERVAMTMVGLAGMLALGPPAHAVPSTSGSWVEVPGPSIATPNSFAGVVSLTSADAWAVGGQRVADQADEVSLTAHWDGRNWTAVASPGQAQLRGVAGTPGGQIWAVGSTDDGTRSVIQVWKGNSWSTVRHVSATPDNPLNLNAVATVGTGEAWAVGFRGTLDTGAVPHAQHYNGVSWQEVEVPQPPDAFVATLTSVSAHSVTDVWATGLAFGVDGFIPYFIHWDGQRWSMVQPPANIIGGYSDVQAIGSGHVIAVGVDFAADEPAPRPVIASLRGGVWDQEKVSVAAAELNAVASDGAGNMWAVGTSLGDGGHDDRTPLILQRTSNGSWSAAPSTFGKAGDLLDIQSTRLDSVRWAVGSIGVTDETKDNLIMTFRPSDGG
jgi:hypothetical protein